MTDQHKNKNQYIVDNNVMIKKFLPKNTIFEKYIHNTIHTPPPNIKNLIKIQDINNSIYNQKYK